jgi:hypothetical protein
MWNPPWMNRGFAGLAEFDAAMNDANEAFREAQKGVRGDPRSAMEMARLADLYVADAKRQAGSDSFRRGIAEGLEARVKELRHELAELLRPLAVGRGKPVPAELQSMSYYGNSLSRRRG